MNLRFSQASEITQVGTFVDREQESHFFHKAQWPLLLERTLGMPSRSLIMESGGQIVGLLPLSHVRSRLFGHSLCSLPFCAYGGPLIASGVDRTEAQRLIQAACQEAERLGVRRLEIRGQGAWVSDAPAQDLYSTFIGPIPSGLDDLSGVPQKRRNVLRKAQGLGLTAHVHRDADRFFELYAENSRSHGTPGLGKFFFRELVHTFDASELDILTVVDSQQRDVSTILNFYHRDTVMAYFAGENALARQCNGNDFKYWSLMRHARDRGCTTFDFGRSKRGTGSFEFKRLWGFRPTPLRYEFPYLPGGQVPQNNPNNPKFELAMRVWSRLPRALTDHLGPRIVGGLG